MLKKLTKMLKKDFGKCAAVIVAAGSSSRMQGTDKILASLDGEPLIAHTIRAFQESPVIHEIVVVTREELLSHLSRLCQQRGFDKVTMIVPGGETRVHSVMKGLDQVSKDVDLAAIHDGARPFVTQQIIEQTVRKAWSFHAAAPAVPVKDTIKAAENLIVTEELAMMEGAGAEVAGIMAITKVAALAYLMFNLFSPPCFAALGAMNSEMGARKWFWGGVALQFATGYSVAFWVYQIGTLITTGALGAGFLPGLIAEAVIVGIIVWLCVNADKKAAAAQAVKK